MSITLYFKCAYEQLYNVVSFFIRKKCERQKEKLAGGFLFPSDIQKEIERSNLKISLKSQFYILITSASISLESDFVQNQKSLPLEFAAIDKYDNCILLDSYKFNHKNDFT